MSLAVDGETCGSPAAGIRGADKAKRLQMSTIPRRRCAQCGAAFKPIKIDQSFCGADCRKFYHELRHRLGGRLLDLAILWRGKKVKGGFSDFTAQVDSILRDYKGQLGHAVSDGSAGNGRKVKVT